MNWSHNHKRKLEFLIIYFFVCVGIFILLCYSNGINPFYYEQLIIGLIFLSVPIVIGLIPIAWILKQEVVNKVSFNEDNTELIGQLARSGELRLPCKDLFYCIHRYEYYTVLCLAEKVVYRSGYVEYHEHFEIVGFKHSLSWTMDELEYLARDLENAGIPAYEAADKSFFNRMFE